MKKETMGRAKRVVAALTIGAAMSLSIIAQDRSGYISSTGGTDTQTTTEAATETTDGTGTLGSSNLIGSEDTGMAITLWNWIGEFI